MFLRFGQISALCSYKKTCIQKRNTYNRQDIWKKIQLYLIKENAGKWTITKGLYRFGRLDLLLFFSSRLSRLLLLLRRRSLLRERLLLRRSRSRLRERLLFLESKQNILKWKESYHFSIATKTMNSKHFLLFFKSKQILVFNGNYDQSWFQFIICYNKQDFEFFFYPFFNYKEWRKQRSVFPRSMTFLWNGERKLPRKESN